MPPIPFCDEYPRHISRFCKVLHLSHQNPKVFVSTQKEYPALLTDGDNPEWTHLHLLIAEYLAASLPASGQP
eukprot:scaffold22562_cov153-Cylindrotheca_fusiformis.AAC.4